MRQHEYNAKFLATYLQDHPLITNVYYPGRGGMLSFEVVDEKLVEPFLQSLKLFSFAESLGGVESFLTYPVTQTHMDIPEDTRKAYGLSNSLLRAAIGVEHYEDLIADLERALKVMDSSEVT